MSLPSVYESAFKDIIDFTSWAPCKKRKKKFSVSLPCFNKNGKCSYCKKQSLFYPAKFPKLSLLHKQCLYSICGEQINGASVIM